MAEWQNRPLDAVCPVVFIDAVHVKIRDGAVASRPVYVVTPAQVSGAASKALTPSGTDWAKSARASIFSAYPPSQP
ncbi:hypothetical protein QF026_008407 [Streptomyces aurantiacus]|nr:hypothetical protein [Streptomyces aurantiacus]